MTTQDDDYDDDDAGRHTTTCDNARRWRRPTVTSRDDERQRITTGSYYCKPRFANLLILPTYDFNLKDMQSTVISKRATVPVTMHGTQTSGAQRPQINIRLYTTYWSREVAEYDGWKADVLHIDIRLLPAGTSAVRICAFYHRPRA